MKCGFEKRHYVSRASISYGSVRNSLEGASSAWGLCFIELSRGLDNCFAIITAVAGKRTTDVARIAAKQTIPVNNSCAHLATHWFRNTVHVLHKKNFLKISQNIEIDE
jgi:hypothetical protein